jgi:predicted nucleic acid-binding protein
VRTAIDTNAISALWSREPLSQEIAALLGQAQTVGGLVICAPVYAELLAHPRATVQFVQEFLATTGIAVEFDLQQELWHEVAERFALYADRRRRSGGAEPKRLLADFMIGAHALHRADRLLTLDFGRYRQDFPELSIWSP